MTYERLEGFVLFPIAEISVPEFRQRNAAEADDALVASIEARGLMNPIILHGNGALVAGERRLDAFRKLKKEFIPARLYEELSPIERYEAELQENLARKQLTWQETVAAIGGYHSLRVDHYKGWTPRGTATALGISEGHLSLVLAVFADIEDEEVSACPTLRGAFNLISGRAERASMAAQSRGLIAVDVTRLMLPAVDPNATKEERTAALLANLKTEKIAGETVEEIDKSIKAISEGKAAAALLSANRKLEIASDLVITADFLEWAAVYSGPKFDVLHIDFPYGKNYSGPRTRRTGKANINPVYADDPDVYFGLIEGLLTVQDQIAFPAAHIILWFDMLYYDWTINTLKHSGWQLVQPYPFIWSKGYSGVAADVKRRPRHVYETALLFSRGDRKIVKLDKDVIDCPIDEKLHLNQKPIAMLKHLLGIFVDEHTAVLDPTCGSGSALAAAKLLGAARVLGIEIDPNNADVAKLILQRSLPSESEDEQK